MKIVFQKCNTCQLLNLQLSHYEQFDGYQIQTVNIRSLLFCRYSVVIPILYPTSFICRDYSIIEGLLLNVLTINDHQVDSFSDISLSLRQKIFSPSRHFSLLQVCIQSQAQIVR